MMRQKALSFFRYIFLSLFLLTPVICVAEGIPLDVLKNDPHFMGNTIQEEIDRQNEKEAAEKDADDYEFYKEGLEKALKELEKANEENKAAELPYVPTLDNENIHDDEKYRGFEKEEVEIPESIEEEVKEEEQKKIVDKRIDFSFGYMAFFLVPLEDTKIAQYTGLKENFNINPWGAAAKLGIMTLPSLSGVNGFGFSLNWNPISYEGPTYTFFTQLVSLNFLLIHKFSFFEQRIMLELHAGAGAASFLFPTFTYKNGYKPDSAIWIYPEVTGGFAAQFYFTRHWGLDINADLMWPFLAGETIPFVQLTIASGWHF